MKWAYLINDQWVLTAHRGNRFDTDERYCLAPVGARPCPYPMALQGLMARVIYQNEDRGAVAFPYREGGAFFQQFMNELMVCPRDDIPGVMARYRLRMPVIEPWSPSS